MKLDTHYVVTAHSSNERAAMVGCRQYIVRIGCIKMIAMQKIRLARFDQRRALRRNNIVPAHMRNFQICSRYNRADVATDPTEPARRFMLNARIRQQLHTDANTQKWNSVNAHALLHRGNHAINRGQRLHTMRKGANAGQNDTVGFGNNIRIGGDMHVACARRFQRIVHRMQIARAIINQRK